MHEIIQTYKSVSTTFITTDYCGNHFTFKNNRHFGKISLV